MAKPPYRSATITSGIVRTTTRSFLYALGQDDEDIARPHIGVIHTGGEMSPCNLTLLAQAQHAKTGIHAHGGTPHECPVVSVSDGLSVAHSGMRFSLISPRPDRPAVWPGQWGEGGTGHRRPLLRRHAGPVHRLCRPGSGG
ncbi:dihydroxy-acid dehydratase [Niveispirillum sp.]|uniref:dihydroxy-acid dehydratase domain-containing protein n=1 Tax=Niveispirillum sp. TaxID=1917217 RepID=UPI001B61D24E|nr:dihydroxy-acid dehydratase [Niveispirillum sp.]MBP7339126.1 dihydroxy-acid dehydratase [Niveispirillum sp.]